MRILLLVNKFHPEPGGLATHAWEVARGLVARGHEVSVVCERRRRSPQPHEMVGGVTVQGHNPLSIRGRRWLLEPWLQVRWLRTQLRNEVNRADVVIVFLHTYAWAAKQVNPGVPLCYIFPAAAHQEIHLDFPAPSAKMRLARGLLALQHWWIQRQALLRADGLMVISQNMRRRLEQAFRVPTQRIVVNPPGAPQTNRVGSEEVARLRNRLGIPSNGQVVLTVARLIPHKQLDVLIDAFQQVGVNDAHLIIVGDGPQRQRLEALARHYRLAERVHCMGFQEDLRPFYQCAAVFVLPSRYEGFGLVYLEAMAQGVPCVGFKPRPPRIIGATDEIIEDGVTGFCVEEPTSTALAEALTRLLQDEALRTRMGQAARLACETRFRWSDHADRLLEACEQMIGDSARARKRTHGDSRKTVLYLETGSGYGGSAQSLHQLLSAIDRARLHPIVAAYNEGSAIEQIRRLGVPVHLFPGLTARSSGYGRLVARWAAHELPRMIRLMRLIHREHVDVVHLNTDLYSTVAALWAAKLTGRPVVCHLRLLRAQTKVERALGGLVDEFVVMTHYAQAFYRSCWPEKPIRVIYNAVAVADGVSPSSGDVCRKNLGLLIDIPLVGLLARCVPGKGYEEFIKAAALVRRQAPQARFVIVGNDRGGDPTYEAAMRRLANDQGLNGSLTWLGWQEDVPRILSVLSVVAQVSTFPEGFGRVAIEAMACGTPVIATALPVFKEVIGEAGVLVEPGDIGVLAEAILTLLRNPSMARTYGEKGRQRVTEQFSLQAHAERITQLYEEVLEGRASVPTCGRASVLR